MNVITQTWSKIPTVNIIKKRFDDVWIYWENDVIGWLNDGTNAHWVQAEKSGGARLSRRAVHREVYGRPDRKPGRWGEWADRGSLRVITLRGSRLEIGMMSFEKKYSKLLPKRFERALLAELTMR